MADITIQISEQSDGWHADVTIAAGGSTSSHEVSMDNAYYEKLSGGKYTPSQVIETSFEFLLDREPKESILSSFELPVISRYFSSYENQLPQMLQEKYG